MTFLQTLGVCLIVLPFVVAFVVIAVEDSLAAAIGIYATTLGLVTIITAGSFLAFGATS